MLLTATITDAIVISTFVFVFCFVLIYLIFFHSRMNENPAADSRSLPSPKTITKDEYEFIADRLLKVEHKYKTVLFAAPSIDCLPVTIPVNVAVRLCENNKKCLLVDMDTPRDPVAKAFQIHRAPDTSAEKPQIHTTSLDNLHVWPAHNFDHENSPILAELVKESAGRYDFIIVSAPYMSDEPKQKYIAAASDCAFLFAKDTSDTNRMSSVVKQARCSIIGNIKLAQ